MNFQLFPLSRTSLAALCLSALCSASYAQNDLKLTPRGYFRSAGVDVMAFDDIYPEGHQSGVSVLMNGHRVATNGDIRLEATPGQWQAVPKQLSRTLTENCISTTLCYPDTSRHMTGFNPMVYPDLHFSYTVNVRSIGRQIEVTVDLDKPLPKEYVGIVGFNMELFPGDLFGKPWIMDNQSGIFPQQPNSPVVEGHSIMEKAWNYQNANKPQASVSRLEGVEYSPISADKITALPYASGYCFTSRPDDPYSRLTVESKSTEIALIDGRMNHNNGWFVLRSLIPEGATKEAVKWIISPNIVDDWHYAPVVQTSQVGYHPAQNKEAVVETEAGSAAAPAKLLRITPAGEQVVMDISPKPWGDFLRYTYYHVDFSEVNTPGLYQIQYADSRSEVFRIGEDIYDRGVWQPVIEYFLPVQMCHMRVADKYHVWHGACHLDDALMAPVGNHIDGYVQNAADLPFSSGKEIKAVNIGGWHDAGDFDLRIESQMGESYILSLAYEAFHPSIDVTTIDHHNHKVEIHQPDGVDDILQQIENGALSVVSGYNALGRLYRGIICEDLRQYVLLGDASTMTDNIPGNRDDRRIYTEDNPSREMTSAAQLAATSRVLRSINDSLATQCLDIAKVVFSKTKDKRCGPSLYQAAAELYLTTKDDVYKNIILDNQEAIIKSIAFSGWYMARVEQVFSTVKDKRCIKFSKAFRSALVSYKEQLQSQIDETPYGVPYRPHIWGAGWDIQGFGFRHYFLASAYPEIFSKAPIFDALNFVLGCHPGLNGASFASGVGAKSATVGYGLNRADWSYIPGGVISGTALIRPDFPELLTFPFLWQQTEYVLGGGSSHYMFLVLAAQHFCNGNNK